MWVGIRRGGVGRVGVGVRGMFKGFDVEIKLVYYGFCKKVRVMGFSS